ncbi:MAG: DUF1349 domain-containing protein [Luteolibacter sp.]
MQWRSSTDGSSSNSNTAGTTAPYWVRMARVGNVLTGSYSADGVTWTQQSTATITMGTDVYVGLSLCANNTSSTCTATFDSFSVTPLVNKGALVNAGSDQTVATSSVSLSGSVSDDGQPQASPMLLWSQVSGTGTTAFGNAAAASTSASFSSSGTLRSPSHGQRRLGEDLRRCGGEYGDHHGGAGDHGCERGGGGA